MGDTEKAMYKEVLGDGESLEIFLRNMRKFERRFCDCMIAGIDFTLKFEIHGNKGGLIHCRVTDDGFDRPQGKSKKSQ